MKRLFTLLLSGAMALTAQTASASASIDTISNLSSRDTLTLYTFNGSNSGYLSGNNSYGDLEKAEQFRGPLGANVTGALIGFGYAYILPADSSTTVTINVYSGTASGPNGTTIATATVTLAQIAAAITGGTELYVPFSGAPALTDQTFFVSVVLPTSGDTIAVLTNQQTSLDGQGWEMWSDNSWNYFPPIHCGHRVYELYTCYRQHGYRYCYSHRPDRYIAIQLSVAGCQSGPDLHCQRSHTGYILCIRHG